jgi:hypothetical protein
LLDALGGFLEDEIDNAEVKEVYTNMVISTQCGTIALKNLAKPTDEKRGGAGPKGPGKGDTRITEAGPHGPGKPPPQGPGEPPPKSK